MSTPSDGATQAKPPAHREGEPQTRVHLHLYTSDIEWIDSMYGDTIKRSKFVRAAVRKVIKGIRAKMEQAHTPHATSNEANEHDK